MIPLIKSLKSYTDHEKRIMINLIELTINCDLRTYYSYSVNKYDTSLTNPNDQNHPSLLEEEVLNNYRNANGYFMRLIEELENNGNN